MGVTVEVEEILDGLGRAIRGHLTRSHESSKGLRHLDVDQMWGMPLLSLSKQAPLDPSAERRLREVPAAPTRR